MIKEIVERRTCRKFDPNKMVKEEDINDIIQAGLLAPSGLNSQEVIIIAITNKEIRDKLSVLNSMGRGGDPFYGAPVVLLVIAKKSFLAEVNGACVIENMLLEATHLGLGTGWIHRAKEEIESEEGRELLKDTGINFDDYVGIGHVILGYNDGYEPAPKEIKPNRVYRIK